VRTGQTEGSVDLARLAGLPAAGVICEVMNDDGTMSRMPDLRIFGEKHGIRIVTIADLIRYRMRHEVLVERICEGPLPMRGHGEFSTRLYRSQTDGSLHMAVWRGELSAEEPCLTRVAAYCPTGDTFGSLACDCGAQLDASLAQIAANGRGVLLYMHVGATAHAEALAARVKSHLGLTDAKAGDAGGGELRELGMGAQILADLGLRQLRLMTNNPRKIVGLEGYGLDVVERVPLQIPTSAENASFLAARRVQLGHLLAETAT
jgi:3,4-dihydroxy 2-butanone 4-phosphate synthase/GTP cyclohydrolase II